MSLVGSDFGSGGSTLVCLHSPGPCANINCRDAGLGLS